MSEVAHGNIVSITYVGTLDDGTVFDETKADEPLQFTAGGEEVIVGLSDAVVGMTIGQKKHLVLTPELAYGDYDPELEQSVPRDELPEDAEVGDQLSATSDDDEDDEFPVWIVEINDKEAILDANHPLAGETLTFDIELLSIDTEFRPDMHDDDCDDPTHDHDHN
jgi:peptidylprolyl isomerase